MKSYFLKTRRGHRPLSAGRAVFGEAQPGIYLRTVAGISELRSADKDSRPYMR